MALTLSEQLRASHVKRWQIVNTVRPQNLAEHHYNVSVIAGALVQRTKDPIYYAPKEMLRLLYWSLTHDIIEVLTGDTPTPYKRVLKQVAGLDVIDKSEEVVDADYIADKNRVAGTTIEMYVELADLIEAIWFLSDHGVGAHAQQVKEGMQRELAKQVIHWQSVFSKFQVREAVEQVCKEIGI